jgi:glutamate dehydrogenase
MTTRSIHQYVTGIYEKLSLDEASCTKFQTGGPDGDLGSNEIKISHDKTIAIVDGSGVICDPSGLNREELLHLAMKRRMIANFDVSKLGPGGFRVLVDEHDVTLPDESIVEDGLQFRNEFHLHPLSSADVFVPCGGRPEAVDINNVHRLLDGGEGKPRFKYIVEGANLFFTQDARLRLEQAGAIIFKDASANKGGVTSSSLEVLAALAFTDEEFGKNMQVTDGVVPEFYAAYITQVHEIIERNAALEFECLWREHARCGQPISTLSDDLSLAILRLNAELQEAGVLWENEALRRLIIREALPPLLVERIGLDVILKRLPESYLRALFGSNLASRFVYQHGITPNQFAFFEFMAEYYNRLK